MAQVQPIRFGYSHPLKTAYKKGLLPTVKYDAYGNLLTKENVSLEHIIPHSKGGKTVLSNLLLANKKTNNLRGVRPLYLYASKGMILFYLEQFKNIKNQYIDGNEYIKLIKETLEKEHTL